MEYESASHSDGAHERDGVDVIEVELSALDARKFSEALAAGRDANPADGRGDMHMSKPDKRLKIALAVAAPAIALLAGVAYLAAKPVYTAPPPVPVVAQAEPVAEPEPAPVEQAQSVRYKNPFDHREEFEFPAGTTKAEARDKVAEILMDRARERRTAMPQHFRNKRTTARTALVAGNAERQ
jgi:hypothetical protein